MAATSNSPKRFITRKLTFVDSKGEPRQVTSDELIGISGPKVILGEPGMGKTELLENLGEVEKLNPITATRFALHKRPEQLVAAGQQLLVDGLDETIARRDGDAVDMVVAQLEAAGSPDFLLSCRSREWQARSRRLLESAYSTEPLVFTLQPFSREDATDFLSAIYPAAQPETVIEHLEALGLGELYGNPLTLGLFGRIAETDGALPTSRGAMFEQAAQLLWQERNDDRDDTDLAQLSADAALSAAGAISAALIFSGAEAVTLAGSAAALPNDVRLAEIEKMPGGANARVVFSSNLFSSIGEGRAKPLHRTLAEFLAAKWLGEQAQSPRLKRRLAAQLLSGCGIPASLRGMVVWLAWHDEALASKIIAKDPFGLLLYGDISEFKLSQKQQLLRSLQAYSQSDPYFRANDWHRHTATSLMDEGLKDEIQATIENGDRDEHLRSLLIESLEDTPLAETLANSLETVLLSPNRFYRERWHAGRGLLLYRSDQWWQDSIAALRDTADEDSTRLACDLLELTKGAGSTELVVTSILADMGLIVCPADKAKARRQRMIKHYASIFNARPSSELPEVLNLLSEYWPLVRKNAREEAGDLADLVSALMIRCIDDGVVIPSDTAQMWRWLHMVGAVWQYHRDGKKELIDCFKRRPDLRRAIQHYVLYEDRPHDTVWMCGYELERRLLGLSAYEGDLVWFLDQMESVDNRRETARSEWRDFMRLARTGKGLVAGALEAGRKFAGQDEQLSIFLEKLEDPKKQAWELKRDKNQAKADRKARINQELNRRHYAKLSVELKAGEFRAAYDPAKAYLGHFRDLKKFDDGKGRIADWLGTQASVDAILGFEAALHRDDLPDPSKISKGVAEGTWYKFTHVIVAGLLSRYRMGRGFSGIPRDTIVAGLLTCYYPGNVTQDDDFSDFQAALEAHLFKSHSDRLEFARLLVEPSVLAGKDHVTGLYMLHQKEEWHKVGAQLAEEYLSTHFDLNPAVEAELINCLTHSRQLVHVQKLARARATFVHPNFDHLQAWLAIDVLVRFDDVKDQLAGIGSRHRKFIWYLRNRLQEERRGALLPLSVEQTKWVISEFRAEWPYKTLRGSGSGSYNSYDATDFLNALIARLANDTGAEATKALQSLIAEPEDTYSDSIRHMAAEQAQKRAEERFEPLTPASLAALLSDGEPTNIDDLKSLVVEELVVAQSILHGDDLDQVGNFWRDGKIPETENKCRDLLAALIGPRLERYKIQRITEADMPKNKRADLAFAIGQMQLPLEAKGQWHDDVWDAVASQLDAKYLIDWRSEQRGIYCVFWFGELPSKTGRRLKPRPNNQPTPSSAMEMQKMLEKTVPAERSGQIDIVVIDLTAGSKR